jgi:hypothetical protein
MRLRQPSEVDSVRQARRSLSLVRQRLMKPTVEALDACMPHLHNAIQSIHRLQRLLDGQELQSPAPGGTVRTSRGTLQAELAAVRRELSNVTALMRSASGFYGGLSSLLSSPEDDLTGYAPGGAVSARAMPTLQFEG